jgi:hypothetical protein
LAAGVAAALLASGCGQGADDTGVTTTGLLSAALADTAETSSYRVSLSAGIKLSIAGEELSTGLDEQNPVFFGEVGPEREHYTFDLSTFLETLLGFSMPGWDDLGFEMWSDQERIVMDTTSLQFLADLDPDVDMGPTEPGVFFIDLATLGSGNPELMNAVAGSSTPDLREMAVSLPAALTEIEQTSTNPPTFVGTTTSARLTEALGGDVENEARCEAAQLGMTSPEDLDELAGRIVQIHETSTAEVVIELDKQGLLSVLWTKEDYSAIFRVLSEFESFGTELSEEERQEAAELFESTELVLATRIAYESDADIEVPPPPPTTEDRTEEWRELIGECGF